MLLAKYVGIYALPSLCCHIRSSPPQTLILEHMLQTFRSKLVAVTDECSRCVLHGIGGGFIELHFVDCIGRLNVAKKLHRSLPRELIPQDLIYSKELYGE